MEFEYGALTNNGALSNNDDVSFDAARASGGTTKENYGTMAPSAWGTGDEMS